MKKTILISLAITLSPTLALASTAIECGKNVDLMDGTVDKRIFLLSSEDGEPLVAYNAADERIKGAKISEDSKGNIVLTVTRDQGFGGPVGEKFVIDDPNGDISTKAHHIMIGGFAGGSEVGTLDCIVSEM